MVRARRLLFTCCHDKTRNNLHAVLAIHLSANLTEHRVAWPLRLQSIAPVSWFCILDLNFNSSQRTLVLLSPGPESGSGDRQPLFVMIPWLGHLIIWIKFSRLASYCSIKTFVCIVHSALYLFDAIPAGCYHIWFQQWQHHESSCDGRFYVSTNQWPTAVMRNVVLQKAGYLKDDLGWCGRWKAVGIAVICYTADVLTPWGCSTYFSSRTVLKY